MSRLSGSDIDFFSGGNFDPSFTADISNRMRVPKNIRVVGGRGDGENGDTDEMNENWKRGGGPSEKGQMQVPDRIIVTGHEQHKGSKSLPRELQLEAVVMPPDPEFIRIQTPPRSITLQNAQHSSARPDSSDSYGSNDEDETLVVENNRARFEQGILSNRTDMISYIGADNSVSVPRRGKREVRSYPSDGNEELEHLREQLSRMNRRLLSVEEDSSERKEKERYLVIAGLLYIAYKTVTWLVKSSGPHY